MRKMLVSKSSVVLLSESPIVIMHIFIYILLIYEQITLLLRLPRYKCSKIGAFFQQMTSVSACVRNLGYFFR